MKKKGLVFFLLLLPLLAMGQLSNEPKLDTVVQLAEVSVASPRMNYFTAGTTIEKMDKSSIASNQSGSLSDLFVSSSNIQVNTYGPGGVSSISIRGGKTRNTAVLWNGLNLQNPMSGGANIANIPSGFFSSVKIQKGHTVSLFGSGATSGIIHLDNNIPAADGTTAKIFGHYGSYDNRSIGGSLAFRNNGYASSLKLFMHDADNNFRYKNPYPNGPEYRTQQNAAFQQKGLLWDNHFQLSQNQLISGGIWFQQSHKEIQPIYTNYALVQANQQDKSTRSYIQYSLLADVVTLRARQGLMYDEYLYRDPEGPEPRSFGKVMSSTTELESIFKTADNIRLNIGISNIYEVCRADMYTQHVERIKQGLFGSFSSSLINHKIMIAVNLRQEMVDALLMPFTFSAGMDVKLPVEGLTAKGSLSRNNLIPALNDLYWKETRYARGNPDLKNEESWNTEAGLH